MSATVDYYFFDPGEFNQLIASGELVEHAEWAGNCDGTLHGELENRAGACAPILLEIEVEGARQVRAALPSAVRVFITPPSIDELRTRLARRGTDHPAWTSSRDSRSPGGASRVRPRDRQRPPRRGDRPASHRLESELAHWSSRVPGGILAVAACR